ncbi:MAG: DUF1573 domain-containing protein [Bacteroidales bacterium]|nr:DUF1573 domain-containing protein [Bacteroidales bacterium]
MKSIKLTIALTFAVLLAAAQPQLTFESTSYDFGNIKEEGGKVTWRFIFTNTGNSDLILKSVRPSCGCTAADYTKTPVAPGEKGFIDATYDPYNRPGGFTKNIRVTTNEPKFNDDKVPPTVIYIKGFVERRPPTIFEQSGFNAGRGMMRFRKPEINLRLRNTESHTDTVKFKNFNTRAVKIGRLELPKYITEVSRSFENTIVPDEIGFIVLKYDATQRNDWGKLHDHILINTDDTIEEKKIFKYEVEIIEDFSYLKPNSKLPVFFVNRNEYNFGRIKPGEKVEYSYEITNNGEADLIVRKITTNYDYVITWKLESYTIKPKQTVKLNVTFDTSKRRGKQNGMLTLTTNDPANSSIVLRIFGDIQP